MPPDRTMPMASLDKLAEAAEARGVKRHALFARAGLELADRAAGLRYGELAVAYEAAALLTGDCAFGLHLGEEAAAHMYGLPGYLVAHGRTFGEALEDMAAHQGLWSQAAGFQVEVAKGRIRLRYWHDGMLSPAGRRQESEHMLSSMLAIVRDALHEPVAPIEIRFEHRPPPDTAEHQRIFRCRVRFGAAATEMILPAGLMNRTLPKADMVLGELVRRQAAIELGALFAGEPLLHRFHLLVRAAVAASGDLSLSGLAAAMRTSPRSLQRRLKEAGLTHSAVVERERMEAARRLLADPGETLAGIAFRLGYSQPSAFHRAFRRHEGVTPLAFRHGLQP